MSEEYKMVELDRFDGTKIKVIGDTSEPGSPEFGEKQLWKQNMGDRASFMKYIVEAERHFYKDMDQWFGSEKRKNPA